MNRLLVVLFGVIFVSCGSLPVTGPYDCANPPDLAGQLLRSASAIEGKYIVVLKSSAPLSIASFAQAFVEVKDVKAFESLTTFVGTMSAATALKLAADPTVLYVQEDGIKHTLETWGLDRIDQRDLPLNDLYAPALDGTGVHAYIIDTGIDRNHADFSGRMGECYSAVGGSCADDHNHGTHVAGTIAGSKWGVAKGVTVHAVKVLINGTGSDSDVIEGIDWAITHAKANGWPAVLNLSLGGSAAPALDNALCQAIERGIGVAVAAGNDSGKDACTQSPARVLQAACAGASAKDDDVAYFSNLGQCVDVFAPGENITSSKRGGGSMQMSGTSMASPHVAGGLALCLVAGAADPRQCVIDNASVDKLSGVGDSPNLLLYVGLPE